MSGWLINPYDADRNIHGRWGRVFLDPAKSWTEIPANQIDPTNWMANATEISYSVAIDKSEVKRSGTRWNDNKAGSYSGTGSLSFDKVNSLFETIMLPFINGTSTKRRLPVFTLTVNLEDPGQPGAEWDDDGNMIKGQESVNLKLVRFWGLEGGFGSDMLSRSVEFTFSGIEMPHQINDMIEE